MKKKSTTLTLSLKRKWFDLIKSGVKLEEYREYNSYWCSRFFVKEPGFKDWVHVRIDYTELVFTLGYPKKDDMSRRLVFKNPRIQIRTGKPEWGAEPGKIYFVITWDSANAEEKEFPMSIYEKNQFKPPYSCIYDPLETVFIKVKVPKEVKDD